MKELSVNDNLRTLADSWEKLRAEARTGSSIAKGDLAMWLDANSDGIIAFLRDAARAWDEGDWA